MRVVSRKALREYWEEHAQARASLENWHNVISSRAWGSLADLKKQFSRSVDDVGDDHFVFNIGDNFRLVAIINFVAQKAFVRRILTHKEYSRIKDISSL